MVKSDRKFIHPPFCVVLTSKQDGCHVLQASVATNEDWPDGLCDDSHTKVIVVIIPLTKLHSTLKLYKVFNIYEYLNFLFPTTYCEVFTAFHFILVITLKILINTSQTYQHSPASF